MNKKGFTLVELLAAVTILGILMMVAIPAVTNMIKKNRDRIYLTDAQKLISLAEYNVKAKSSQIQLPSRGYSIVFTFKYLDNGDFENTPSDGTYDPTRSFVVAKNTANGLVYSVMLVEKIKGGSYRGIDLTTRESLINANASVMVKDFAGNAFNSYPATTAGYLNYIKFKLGNTYTTGVQYLKNA